MTPHHTTLHHITPLHFTKLHHITSHYTALDHTTPYHTPTHHTPPYHITPCQIIPHHTTQHPHHTTSNNTTSHTMPKILLSLICTTWPKGCRKLVNLNAEKFLKRWKLRQHLATNLLKASLHIFQLIEYRNLFFLRVVIASLVGIIITLHTTSHHKE